MTLLLAKVSVFVFMVVLFAVLASISLWAFTRNKTYRILFIGVLALSCLRMIWAISMLFMEWYERI